jgi:hypothetical protein
MTTTHSHANPLDTPVSSAGNRFTERVPVVPGRLVGSVAGLLGVALAAPLVFLPTRSIILATEPGASAQLTFWSWGRIADVTTTLQEPLAFDNNVQLVFFIVSLVIGVAGCLVYAFRAGADGRILGALAIAWTGGQVVSDLMRGVGDATSGLWSQGALGVELLIGGMLQIASAVAFCCALVAIGFWPLLRLVRSGWAWAVAIARRVAERRAHDEPQDTGPPPRVGVATIRDARPRADQPAWHGSEGVGFSDDSGSDPGRFRPPP